MKFLSSISVKPAPRREGDVPSDLSACPRAAHPVGRYAAVRRAFTLVEMLVSMALLAILGYILLQITTLVATTNARVSGGVSAFQDASIAFDTLTKTLSQATLNTYIDYYPSQLGFTIVINAGGNTLTTPTPPTAYIRQSELHFVCGPAATLVSSTAANNPTHSVFFQAPLGYSTTYSPVPDLLNACGFYVQFGSNSTWLPTFLPTTSNLYRYRLMEMIQPTESIEVYTDPGLSTLIKSGPPPEYQSNVTIVGGATKFDSGSTYSWITDATATAAGNVRPLADNIIALIFQPMLDPTDQTTQAASFPSTSVSTTGGYVNTYQYDSRIDPIIATTPPTQQLEQNQLPPMMQVTMVAIDEPSAVRLAAQYGTASPDLITKADAYGSDSALFTQTASFAADIQQLTGYLTSIHVKYRVFTAQVPMFNAKWSTH